MFELLSEFRQEFASISEKDIRRMKYDDPFDINPPFNPYISFTTPIRLQLKNKGNKPKPTKKLIRNNGPSHVGSTTIKDGTKHYATKGGHLIEAKSRERDKSFFELKNYLKRTVRSRGYLHKNRTRNNC